jgi:23S rRNA (uridine2552-2'-O)-methyltransferase
MSTRRRTETRGARRTTKSRPADAQRAASLAGSGRSVPAASSPAGSSASADTPSAPRPPRAASGGATPRAKVATGGGPRTARPNDHFGARAKKEGYPARSVYKLEEIDRRVRLLRPGMRVLDLGAFPGSWTKYAAQKVAPRGRVLGLDIQEPRGGVAPNAELRQADIFTVDPASLGRFEVVLTDMAPATTGSRAADQYNSYRLFMAAVAIAEISLVPGGAFVGKIFQGPEFEDARRALRGLFETVRILKPEASRQESYEVFLVGLGRKIAAAPPDAPPG